VNAIHVEARAIGRHGVAEVTPLVNVRGALADQQQDKVGGVREQHSPWVRTCRPVEQWMNGSFRATLQS
jgi:hypothetical protein